MPHLLLDQYLDRFADTALPALLLLDEVQALAGHRAMARIICRTLRRNRRRPPCRSGRGAAPIPQTRQSYVRALPRRGIADPVFERWILDRGPDAF